MNDKILIQGLEVSCVLGTLSRERKKKQRVVIDLEFHASVRKAAKRDDLEDALDYRKIAMRAAQFVSRSRFYLIETLAEHLAQTLLREFKLDCLFLRAQKPFAISNAQYVGIEIFRKRYRQITKVQKA